MSIFSNRINATCPTCGALTHQLAINTVAYKLAGCPECLSTIDITDDAATKALPPKIQEMKKATKTCPNCNAAISDYNKDIVYGTASSAAAPASGSTTSTPAVSARLRTGICARCAGRAATLCTISPAIAAGRLDATYASPRMRLWTPRRIRCATTSWMASSGGTMTIRSGIGIAYLISISSTMIRCF